MGSLFVRRFQFSFMSQLSTGAAPIYAGGSFVIAAVCKDGILIAAESRNTIKNLNGKDLAYYDGVQKVFPVGRSAIAYTGSGFIQNLDFGALVSAFNASITIDIPLKELLPRFINFCDSVLPVEARKQVRSQSLIAAGYIDGQPGACYYNEKQTEGPKTACNLGLVSSDTTILDEYKQQLRSMNYIQLAKLINKAIPDYARRTGALDIGGPIYIFGIFNDYSRWVDTSPGERQWNNLHEFAAAYRKGAINLHLLPGAAKDEVEELIRHGETWSKGGS